MQTPSQHDHSQEPGAGEHGPAAPGAADSHHRRFLAVLFTGLMALALVGFVVGTRSAAPPARVYSPIPETAGAIPGQSYAELRDRRFGPNRAVTSDVSWLGRELVAVPGTPVTPEARRRAVAARSERRAFDGAPPTVPHTIDEQNPGSCLSCHEKGILVAGRIASPLSHPPYTQCTQCHVPSVTGRARPMPRGVAAETLEVAARGNSFVGARSPGSGGRAWHGAPPTIPHRTFMRERCESCHGPAGQSGLRTPHPQNVACTQCHAASLEQGPAGAPPFRSVPGTRVFGAGLRAWTPPTK